MRIRAILNKDGGTLRTMDLDELCVLAKDLFAREGHELECTMVAGEDVEEALKAAASDPSVEAVVAGGGDGTISAAAGIAFKSNKPLGVLPAGTMNLFARALGMPLELDRALAAIARGEVDRIDIATANGRPFVHQFGVGIHARLVRIRNNMVYRSRVGKMLASMRAILSSAVDPPRFDVELHTEKGDRTVTATGVAISNNPLDDSPVPVAESLNSGRLGVYVAHSVSTGELLNLAFDVMTGRWRANPAVSETEVNGIVLHFPKRKRGTHAVVDGELIDLETEVVLKLHAQALPVIRPGHVERSNEI
ncbi:diacylglycerol kinase family enzyme [Devosia subaequoris]|uniref:Diacylglycerol kinase family enzyme n=1 Tax=Devosia subaequoris TaxID=395930 RepID=A0A7W6ILT0_9HYPH|nr:diacylglycerol kinase family protein [Devosia subaequoris]MBB4051978.1 diacylglycerol kinase family enzyme [Devosia subaequoris]MCP1210142.1 diacylglycerol kinase family lipid kinase [Devosia subaequoris]